MLKTGFIVTFFTLFFLFATPVGAQVVINEISPATSPEWVELYNKTSEVFSLDGCNINMGSDSQTVNFTSPESINGLNYKIVTWSSNWLNNSGDSVILTCPTTSDGPITYGSAVNSNESYGRSPNGTGNFVVLGVVTQGAQNVDPTPEPTATTAPTSAPTSAPSPTKTPTPTLSPTKSPTSTPKVKSPTPTPKEETPEPEVLGTNTEPTQTPSPAAESKVSGDKKFPLIAGLLIGLGIIFLGIPVVWFFKNRKKGYNEGRV